MGNFSEMPDFALSPLRYLDKPQRSIKGFGYLVAHRVKGSKLINPILVLDHHATD